ncbi:MAG: hypothetical protein J6I84_02885 [Bacilli bacterium]|nr:hypothetical protein [Bacilli bacterium]
MERVLKEFTSNIEVTPTGYSKMEITVKTFVVIKKVKMPGRFKLKLLPFPPRAWVEPDETRIRYEIIQLLPKYEDEYSFVARNVKKMP